MAGVANLATRLLNYFALDYALPPHKLTTENYLRRDVRLDDWSLHGLGFQSETNEQWVARFLAVQFDCDLPDYLQAMFDRAQANIVYGCFYYPLFTLGIEELYRFNESALRAAVNEAGASKSVQRKKFKDLIDWARQHEIIDASQEKQWQAGRALRNSTSHQTSHHLVGPNDALWHLQISVKMTEQVFMRVRSMNL